MHRGSRTKNAVSAESMSVITIVSVKIRRSRSMCIGKPVEPTTDTRSNSIDREEDRPGDETTNNATYDGHANETKK